MLSKEKEEKLETYRQDFTKAIYDDLNCARGLAVIWEMFKSNIPASDKYDLALSFDDILGLRLAQVSTRDFTIPEAIKKLISDRENLRKEGKFEEADKIRVEIEKAGYVLEDTSGGTRVKRP